MMQDYLQIVEAPAQATKNSADQVTIAQKNTQPTEKFIIAPTASY